MFASLDWSCKLFICATILFMATSTDASCAFSCPPNKTQQINTVILCFTSSIIRHQKYVISFNILYFDLSIKEKTSPIKHHSQLQLWLFYKAIDMLKCSLLPLLYRLKCN